MNHASTTRRPLALVAVLVLALLGPVSAALAWGGLGHRLVARLAEHRLSPAARELVRQLLEGKSMAGVANWADAIRPDRPETAPFHFIAFPRADDWTGDPGEPATDVNVVTALEQFRDVLADPSRPPEDRREALQFLIHLVGDLHQPLHCAPGGDHGGNDLPVWLLDEETNLHRVWDSGLIFGTGIEEGPYLAALLAQENPLESEAWQSGGFAAWARESNREAVFHAYRLPADHRLGERYQAENIRVVNRQLRKAGVRLAAILDEVARQAADAIPLVARTQASSARAVVSAQ